MGIVFDSKTNLNSGKFEQCSSDTLSLSGSTNIFGIINIPSTGSIDSCSGYKISGSTILRTPNSTMSSIYIGCCSGNNGAGINNFSVGYQALKSNTCGCNNLAIGYQTLYSNISGNTNYAAGYQSLYSNFCGCHNVAQGSCALYYNTCGNSNIAQGNLSLFRNTLGGNNTAQGTQALYCNTIGNNNVAQGTCSLFNNISGLNNVAQGFSSLFNNTTGCNNIGIGFRSLFCNNTGTGNISFGAATLCANTAGCYNVGFGYSTLSGNTTGCFNIARGYIALGKNTTGCFNIGDGYYALYSNGSGSNNVAVGTCAGYITSSSSNNIFMGYKAGAYETLGNKLIIDSVDRTCEARGRTEALIYGVSSSTPASQILNLGGGGVVGVNTIAPTATFEVTQLVDGGDGIKLNGTGTGAGGYVSIYMSDANGGRYTNISSSHGTSYRVGGNLLGTFIGETFNIYGGVSIPRNRLGFSQQLSMGYNWADSKWYFANYDQSNKYLTYVPSSEKWGFGTANTAPTAAFDFKASANTDSMYIRASNGYQVIKFLDLSDTCRAWLGNDTGSRFQFKNFTSGGDIDFTTTSTGNFTFTCGKVHVNTNGIYSPVKSLTVGGNFDFSRVGQPNTTSMTASLAGLGAGNLNNGVYSYQLVYVTAEGETGGETYYTTQVTVVDKTTNGQVIISNIPVPTDPRVTSKYLMRSVVNGGIYSPQKINSVIPIATTTYTDNVADASLVAGTTFYRKSNTTSGLFYSNASLILATPDPYHTSFGLGAGANNTGGHSYVMLGGLAGNSQTTASDNTFVGYSAGQATTTGGNNTALGSVAFLNNTTGISNVAIGVGSMRTNSNGAYSYNTAVGTSSLYGIKVCSNFNTALGYQAGNINDTVTGTISANIFIGAHPTTAYNLKTGDGNILIGYNADIPIGETIKNNYLNIADTIFGTGINGASVGAISTGKIGFGIQDPTQQVELSLSMALPNTNSSTTGVIYKGANRFIHNYWNNTIVSGTLIGLNTFAGVNAGNFTMGSTATQNYHASNNTGFGADVLKNVTTGFGNTGVGSGALLNITTGTYNTAIGISAMSAMQSGSGNFSSGLGALSNITSYDNNIAFGSWVLYGLYAGSDNVGFGLGAGRYLADGTTANGQSSQSLYIGGKTKSGLANQTNQIVIGYDAIGNGSNSVTLGSSGITKTVLRGNVETNGSMKVGNDSTVASATNVGAMRYRTSGNNSYVDMAMQTGASTYEWVNITQNNW